MQVKPCRSLTVFLSGGEVDLEAGRERVGLVGSIPTPIGLPVHLFITLLDFWSPMTNDDRAVKRGASAEMTGRERATKYFNNTCQRCGEFLEFDFDESGLCDECTIERCKMQYDAANPLASQLWTTNPTGVFNK